MTRLIALPAWAALIVVLLGVAVLQALRHAADHLDLDNPTTTGETR